ncbi:MAG: site-2 protease family protein [Candidatus Zambryskibacteria bacterium CG11_big_fil_rev_8_21_14_0_20_42_18]|uniref:Site-2 protease family protein n=1 Tax=Candidatus Zambryskibacteria bacterium CG_4_9_14_3_um_filter_42_15 TaxID=1975112 RepID=A0A2M7WS06_9BACT|nr:MAG: site-2 protease family protein [Candidatus Zambryskibacteria bacterium CG11_big_fil_rev_8_21_14_0_20_42_18]PJA32797.1 MAG: site-2 protease family protein [Candidatus Zambryskibacteria bacterium CG_4_9_14_3_um_filter_42_15]
MQVDFLFQIAILIMSVVIHEVSHGYVASYLGDQTARYQGRLTLNPVKHLDFVGSFLVPSIAYFLGGFIFGWAKPVPYNPYNLKPGRWSEALVAVSGPASNVLIALIFGLLLRVGVATEASWANPAFVQITAIIVFINILLGVFNLMPIPPLDGSKLLFALFPDKLPQIREFFEKYGLVLILLFIFFLWQFIFPIIIWLFHLITGVAF